MTESIAKRFWLFCCESYYPAGGLADRISTHDTLDEAKAAGRAADRENWSVYDLAVDETVYSDWEEPEPVNLSKRSSFEFAPVYQSLPDIQAGRGAIRCQLD